MLRIQPTTANTVLSLLRVHRAVQQCIPQRTFLGAAHSNHHNSTTRAYTTTNQQYHHLNNIALRHNNHIQHSTPQMPSILRSITTTTSRTPTNFRRTTQQPYQMRRFFSTQPPPERPPTNMPPHPSQPHFQATDINQLLNKQNLQNPTTTASGKKRRRFPPLMWVVKRSLTIIACIMIATMGGAYWLASDMQRVATLFFPWIDAKAAKERAAAIENDTLKTSVYRFYVRGDELYENPNVKLTGVVAKDILLTQQLLLREALALRIALEDITGYKTNRKELCEQALHRCELYKEELKKGNNQELYVNIDHIVKKLNFFLLFDQQQHNHKPGVATDRAGLQLVYNDITKVYMKVVETLELGKTKTFSLEQAQVLRELQTSYSALSSLRQLYDGLATKQREMCEECEEFVEMIFYLYNQGDVPIEIWNDWKDLELSDDLIDLQEDYEVSDKELLHHWEQQYTKEDDEAYARGLKVWDETQHKLNAKAGLLKQQREEIGAVFGDNGVREKEYDVILSETLRNGDVMTRNALIVSQQQIPKQWYSPEVVLNKAYRYWKELWQ